MARPTKYSPERIDTILAAVRLGETLEHAASAASVSYETLRAWRGQFPAFSAALTHAESDARLLALQAIRKASQRGDWRAAAWWLERRYPAEWGRNRPAISLEQLREVARPYAEASGMDVDELLEKAEQVLLECLPR